MPRRLLQAEGAVLFAAALALYIEADFSILALVLLFLAPDLAFLGFLISPRVGAWAYDALHFEALPILLGAIGVLADERLPVQLALGADGGGNAGPANGGGGNGGNGAEKAKAKSGESVPAAEAMTETPPVVPAKMSGLELGPACEQCGGMMQRTGSCYTCSSCGNNTGCG